MAKLSNEELQQLILRGETSTVELKVAPPRPTELAERLCGMANAQGGILIIGVDDAHRIVGVSNTRLAVDTILRAARQIQPALLLDPLEPEIYTVSGKQLVVASIPRHTGPLYQSSGVCWVRRGTYTVPLTVPEMLEAAHDRGLLSWELQTAYNATFRDIDETRVETYLAQRSPKSHQSGRLGTLEEVLIGMGCARATRQGELLPTNAGILFFGRNPQRHILQSEVVCILYRDTLGLGGYVDRKIVKGTTLDLIDETETFLNKHIAVGARIEGWKRIDLPEYPIEALREAVVNAVIHRDYSRAGESIRVFYYADRIEIHSPGLLLPGITVEQMRRGEVTSRLRNPMLATLLRDVPGYMERVGSGIRFMLHETQRMSLPPPDFREAEEFIVTFRKEPATPPQEKATATHPAAELDQETRVALAMRHVQERGSISNSEYRTLTGISDNTALRDLDMLVTQGVLRSVGKGRARRYKLA